MSNGKPFCFKFQTLEILQRCGMTSGTKGTTSALEKLISANDKDLLTLKALLVVRIVHLISDQFQQVENIGVSNVCGSICTSAQFV